VYHYRLLRDQILPTAVHGLPRHARCSRVFSDEYRIPCLLQCLIIPNAHLCFQKHHFQVLGHGVRLPFHTVETQSELIRGMYAISHLCQSIPRPNTFFVCMIAYAACSITGMLVAGADAVSSRGQCVCDAPCASLRARQMARPSQGQLSQLTERADACNNECDFVVEERWMRLA